MVGVVLAAGDGKRLKSSTDENRCKPLTEVNGKTLIEYALDKYPSGTTIVIAGKGGEKYQDIGGIKMPYNDFDVVNDFFKKRLSGKSVTAKTENIEETNFEEKEIE